MSILRILHANRLAVVVGSSLLCLLGFVAGCDSGNSGGTGTPADVKAKQQDEIAARKKAYGKTGVPTKANSAKPSS